MDYSNLTLFSLMKAKMDVLSARQSVLAENIANADTPGYKTKDVIEPDFNALLRKSTTGTSPKLQVTTTSPNHIAPHSSASHFAVVNSSKTAETSPNGNNVSIEEEMSKVAANQAEYQKTINLYTKAMSMFKTALGNAGGGG